MTSAAGAARARRRGRAAGPPLPARRARRRTATGSSRPARVREAEQLATSHNPDVILLDLGLPDGDGIDLARRLREWTRAPIIVLSARGREEDKVDALDAGADDYLTKPFGVNELLARIRVALRHAQAVPGERAGARGRAAPRRPRPARGDGGRARGAAHADRVPAARAARAARREGADPPPDPEGGLGPERDRGALRARPHGRAAQEDRGRPGAAAAAGHRARRRLPAARPGRALRRLAGRAWRSVTDGAARHRACARSRPPPRCRRRARPRCSRRRPGAPA